MRILIATDKFKGSLTATQVAGALARALQRHLPGVSCELCPIADGGEGTTEAMVTALGGGWREVATEDAQHRPLTARYGWITRPGEAPQAVLEMSAASGLALVSDLPLAPATASTFGTGLMLRDALAQGAGRVLIGIGGSATNDGGLGLAAALGYRFFDTRGEPLEPLPRALLELDRIEAPAAAPWRQAELLVACDVDNPLLGPNGASAVYGPQKGVHDIAGFEARLRHLADVVARDLGTDPRAQPGAGAAGGLGYGLMAFCGARLTGGFDLVAGRLGLEARIRQADLVITGEGRLDAQTLSGKGPAGVARMARALGKPVAAFAGSLEDSPALRACFDLCVAVKPAAMPLAEALQCGEALLEQAVAEQADAIRQRLGLAR